MFYMGVDLGGTNMAAGVVDAEGKIYHQDSTPTGVGRHYSEIIKDMAALVKQVIEDGGFNEKDIHSIGIGSPGVADSKAGTIVFANNLYWHHVPVRNELQKYFDLPVYIDNDATVAGLAEAMCGACQGVENSVTLTLGTGVGSGVILNGKPYSGSHGVGAELGHMIVQVDGIQCTCGNKGCWERYTSASALIREGIKAMEKHPDSVIAKLSKGEPDNVTAKIVIDAAKAGDVVAVGIFETYIYYLAMGIITIINSFDPAIIAIGGGVSKAGDFLMDSLRNKVQQHIFYKDMPHARICLAKLGNDAGIIGAAMLGKLG